MSYVNRRRRPLLAVVVLLLVAGLVACSDTQTTEAPGEPTASAVEEVAEEPVDVAEPQEVAPSPTEGMAEEPTEEPVELPTKEPTEEPTEVPVEPTEEPTEEPPDPERGRIELASVPSPSLADAVVFPAESNDVFVYLPPGYDTSDQSYPVIYTLPGVGFSQMPPQEGVSTITYLLDGLWSDEALQPMMFVFCEGAGPWENSPLFTTDSSFQGDVLNFCAKDVVDYIDANYRTMPVPAGRGLLGDTLTGDGTLRMAMSYPDVFSTVYINLPWVLADGALEETYFTQPEVIEAMLSFADSLKDIPPEEIGSAYPEQVYQINSPGAGFTLDYAMHYMAEPEPPYFAYLYRDGDTPAEPEVWERWEAGIGSLPERVAQGKDGLMQLTGLGLGRGNVDTFSPWAVAGTDELHQLLSESGIAHQWDEYSGGSYELVDRLGTVIMPFFAEHLETEPGS